VISLPTTMKAFSIIIIAVFLWPILFMAGCWTEGFHHAFEEGWNLNKKWRMDKESATH
jgi:hypothetical protein